jgi:PIN domain nuclease of toxin-antitoxin system
MTKILLDTHVILWLTQSERELGSKGRAACEDALARDDLTISPVIYYELADLVRKNRLKQQIELSRWRRELLSMGVLELPVSGAVAIQASELADFHKDPWDRMIVATALVHEAALMTADRAILAWTGALDRIDARK